LNAGVELEKNNLLGAHAVDMFAHITEQHNGGCQPSRDPKFNEQTHTG